MQNVVTFVVFYNTQNQWKHLDYDADIVSSTGSVGSASKCTAGKAAARSSSARRPRGAGISSRGRLGQEGRDRAARVDRVDRPASSARVRRDTATMLLLLALTSYTPKIKWWQNEVAVSFNVLADCTTFSCPPKCLHQVECGNNV